MQKWAEKIASGDVRALARAASAVENRRPEATPLLQELFPRTGRALVLGITGAPGAGKSTLVDQLTVAVRHEGLSAGIIAVDPTSPFSGGAILGDRIRMQRHHGDPGVYIRSMATRGCLGGMAMATTEVALLLDAAGKDLVLIETVGVGQAEVEIARLADVTLVVLVPGMGDDVQSLKAGILEIADVFVINKADRPGADTLQRELDTMLALVPHDDGWVPPIVRTVASEGQGIDALLAATRSCQSHRGQNGRKVELWRYRLREMLRERLLDRFDLDELESAAREVADRQRDPYSVVEEWLRRI